MNRDDLIEWLQRMPVGSSLEVEAEGFYKSKFKCPECDNRVETDGQYQTMKRGEVVEVEQLGARVILKVRQS